MLVKLLKVVKETPIGSIVEVDAEVGQKMVKDGEATEYDEAGERAEAIRKAAKEVAQKSVNVLVKKEIKMKYAIAESFAKLAKMAKADGKSEMEFKAVVGVSEGGANTGADLVATAVTEMQGMWAGDPADIYGRCRKMQLPAGASAVSVPLDTFAEYAMGTAPIITGTAEGGTKNVNAIPTVAALVQPKVVQAIIGVTDEMLEDLPYFDGYLRGKLQQKMGNKRNQLILAGTYGSANGFYGVTDSGASAYVTEVSVSATPTLPELLNFEKAIDPGLRAGAEWVIGNAYWTTIKATFLTAANLGFAIVDPVKQTLLGYPVRVSCNVNDIVLGNWSEYTVVESRLGEQIQTSIHVYFTTDQTLYRITQKIGGTPTYCKRTGVDSAVVSAFAVKA